MLATLKTPNIYTLRVLNLYTILIKLTSFSLALNKNLSISKLIISIRARDRRRRRRCRVIIATSNHQYYLISPVKSMCKGRPLPVMMTLSEFVRLNFILPGHQLFLCHRVNKEVKAKNDCEISAKKIKLFNHHILSKFAKLNQNKMYSCNIS